MSKKTILKDDSNLGKVDEKDNTKEYQNMENEEKLVDLISKILVNKAIKEADEKGYTIFKI